MKTEKLKYLGCFVGAKRPDFMLEMVKTVVDYNATTFMFYSGPPQSFKRVPTTEFKLDLAKEYLKNNNLGDLDDNYVVHAPYLINLANGDEVKRKRSFEFFVSELHRTYELGAKYFVLHPGSALNVDNKTQALDHLVNELNKAIAQTTKTIICLETMADKGQQICSKFEDLKYVIDRIDDKSRIGVCFDTCHVHDAGYDLSDTQGIINQFDQVIGLEYLHVIHLNDSKNPKGSKKDRHANIGYGLIGFDNLINFIYHEKIKDKVIILETPWIDDPIKGEIPLYKEEIQMINDKKFIKGLVNE
ncbi:deoxyribonuclease IV [Mycoplasma bradburyae]|uniref:deoxyribonuclease IV n=1 Tax=Mycoplasma bradburyae TaxID=2963128 RepID=UPI002341E85A|nr:deoxyribonuclease IV [Mycoplasma bradburyae]MDC4184453.1 deoxyribonuclease IV [Mycoplasma bradburyae]